MRTCSKSNSARCSLHQPRFSKRSPERARREAKLQRLLAAPDEQQLQLVIELALAVTRAVKKCDLSRSRRLAMLSRKRAFSRTVATIYDYRRLRRFAPEGEHHGEDKGWHRRNELHAENERANWSRSLTYFALTHGQQ